VLDGRRLVIVVTFIAIFAMAVRTPIDPDGWWHLATGRWIVQEGRIPHQDPFSHTMAGQPWVDNGWLPQIALYLAYRLLGMAGVGLLVALQATLALAFLWPQMRGGVFPRAFLLVFAATVSSPVWTPRPQMTTYLFTALLTFLLHRYRVQEDRRALYPIPLLFVLWVNAHAGYVLGLLLLGLSFLGEVLERLWKERGQLTVRLWRPWLLTSLAALLVVPLNPYGPRMWSYPFYNAGQRFARQYIAEWASPDFHQLHNQPLIWMVLLILAVLGLSRRPPPLADLLNLLAFTYLTFQSQRAMGLFALVATPLLSASLSQLRGWSDERKGLQRSGALTDTPGTVQRWRGQGALNVGIVIVLLLAALTKAYVALSPETLAQAEREQGFPADALAWLRQERPSAPLFNPYNWGGYLIWHLYPDYRVFVDGRADLYGDDFLFQYAQVALAKPGWEAILDRYGVQTALVEAKSPLVGAMAASPAWEPLYEDGRALVFRRKRTAGRPPTED